MRAVTGAEMVAPDLLNVEVISTLRRLKQIGTISATHAAQAINDLVRAPLRRLPTRSLVADIWLLRANVSAYDACYVALNASRE